MKKVIITYDVNEYEREYSARSYSGGEPVIRIHKDKHYTNINFSFEDTNIDEILKDIIEDSYDSNEIKVGKIKTLFNNIHDSIYEFDNDEQRCEIYYNDEPPEKLYIEIDIINHPYHYEGADEDIIPVRVHTVKPEHYYRLLKYNYYGDSKYKLIKKM